MDTLLNMFEGDWLPNVFAFLLGFSLLVYVVLDGYDLGVGILSFRATPEEKDKMVSSIAPFWDANETWLVLGGGLMLVGFPLAQGIVFQYLYIPIAVMLVGLVLRGVAFDFRGKVPPAQKGRWDLSFALGSLMTTGAQGYMLGAYIMGFAPGWNMTVFSCLGACLAVASVCLIGGGWLLMKTEGELQARVRGWTVKSLVFFSILLCVLAAIAPYLSQSVYKRWFAEESGAFVLFFLLMVCLICGIFFVLRRLKASPDRFVWVPFAGTGLIFILNFAALATTFYPWIIMDRVDLVSSAASRDSLMVILVGTLVTLPLLIGYTIVVYRIFHGKVKETAYE